MSRFWSWICCGCCPRGLTKNEILEKEKRKKRQRLMDELRASSESLPVTKTASLDVRTPGFKDIIVIPNKQFSTDVDVFKSVGYLLGNEISIGSFASILTATHSQTKKKIVVKKVAVPEPYDQPTREKRNDMLRDVKLELTELQKIRHPHVCQLIQHLMIKSGNSLTLYILMQFAEFGNIQQMVDENGPFTEDICKRWTAQLLCGMSYMHSNGIAHRDLKMSNILFNTRQHLWITDFGLSRLVWRKSLEQIMVMSSTFCGTPAYMSPEALRVKDDNFLDYNAYLADVWALGVIVFVMFNKSHPFKKDLAKALKQMEDRILNMSKDLKPSQALKDFFKKVFEPNPKLRPKMETLQKHQWIEKEFNKVELKCRQALSQIKN